MNWLNSNEIIKKNKSVLIFCDIILALFSIILPDIIFFCRKVKYVISLIKKSKFHIFQLHSTYLYRYKECKSFKFYSNS